MVQHSSIDHTGITGVPSTISFGSNSNSISSFNGPGSSSCNTRADHVHLGVTSVAHTSNTFSGPVILQAGANIGITSPTSGTLSISGAAAGGGSSSTAHVGAKVYKTAQTVTDAILAFDAELWDSDGFHDNATNNSRLTVPAGLGGKYHVTASTWVSAAARLEIFVNGSIARGRGSTSTASGNYAAAVGDLDLAAGDYVEIKGNAGASRTYGDNGSIGDNTVFSMYRTGT